MSVIDLLRSDGSIIVNKRLAHSIGIESAIMFSELISKKIYFENKNQLTKDGYFFNTVENMKEDTTLSKYQQSKAIKKLVELNLIKQENRGIPQKRYFKITNDDNLVLETLGMSQLSSFLTIRSENTELLFNNTKGNNTKKTHKGCEQDSPRLFYKYSTEKEIQTPISNVVLYYLDMYAEYMGKNHPRLKGHQWDNVVYRLETAYKDDFVKDHYADEHVIKYMIDKHFKTAYPNCDYNILHFISDEVFKNRYYETDRYLNESDI